MTNPVDTTAAVSQDAFRACLEEVAADDGVDAVLAVIAPTALADLGQALCAAHVAKPLAAAVLDQRETVRLLARDERQGSRCAVPAAIPAYAFPESAARALGHAAAYHAWRGRQRGQVPELAGLRTADARACVTAFLHAHPDGGWLSPDAPSVSCSAATRSRSCRPRWPGRGTRLPPGPAARGPRRCRGAGGRGPGAGVRPAGGVRPGRGGHRGARRPRGQAHPADRRRRGRPHPRCARGPAAARPPRHPAGGHRPRWPTCCCGCPASPTTCPRWPNSTSTRCSPPPAAPRSWTRGSGSDRHSHVTRSSDNCADPGQAAVSSMTAAVSVTRAFPTGAALRRQRCRRTARTE